MSDATTFAGQSSGYDDALDTTRGFSERSDAGVEGLRPRTADGIRDALNQLSDEIETRPEIAAGVAMFIGVLLGLALGRPSRAVVYIKD